MAAFFAPVAWRLLTDGPESMMDFLAADIFYYLAVAQNVVRHGIFSYDGTHYFNGFHPLWQVLIVPQTALGEWLGLAPGARLGMLFALSLGLVALALAVLADAFRRAHGALSIWVISLPAGLYGLCMLAAAPGYGTVWHMANGMETPALVLAYAVLVWILARGRHLDSNAEAAALGLAAAAFALARLDHAILLPCLALLLAGQAVARRDPRALARAALALAVPAALLGMYLAINHHYTGAWMPLSGSGKTTFPTINTLALEDYRSAMRRWLGGENLVNDFFLWRTLQLLVPATAAALALPLLAALRWRDKRDPLDTPLLLTVPLVLGLAWYNAAYVFVFDQGAWYVPISILFVHLLALRVGRAIAPRGFLPQGWRAGAVAALLCLLGIATFRAMPDGASSRNVWRYLHQTLPGVLAPYQGAPVKIIEVSDGAFAFAGNLPAMNIHHFALDPAAYRHRQAHGSLVELALQRGHDRIVVWLAAPDPNLSLDSPSAAVGEYLRRNTYLGIPFTLPDDLNRLTYHPELILPEQSTVVVRVAPNPEHPAFHPE